MSGGGRGVVAALAGLAAIFVTLGTGAFFGALYAPHYGYYAEHPAHLAAQAKEHDPSQIDRDRAGLPYFAERIASGPDPQNADEREKRDLAAQESVSVWAFWMLLVSSGGVLVTAIGTGFLLCQIILTRQAVKDTSEATEAMREANEIARLAQRPWLVIENVKGEAITWHRDGPFRKLPSTPRIQTSFQIANIGKGIARGVSIRAWAVGVGHQGTYEPYEAYDAIIEGREKLGLVDGMAPNEVRRSTRTLPVGVSGDASSHITLVVVIHVSYLIDGSEVPCETARVFVAETEDANMYFHVSRGDLGPDQFNLTLDNGYQRLT